jgi:hypothetical protein
MGLFSEIDTKNHRTIQIGDYLISFDLYSLHVEEYESIHKALILSCYGEDVADETIFKLFFITEPHFNRILYRLFTKTEIDLKNVEICERIIKILSHYEKPRSYEFYKSYCNWSRPFKIEADLLTI